MLLKHYLDQGVLKTELSTRFGVNRRTIHNWVKTGQLDRDLAVGARGYTPRPPAAHKLDPCKAIIDARLEAFPKLSAKRLFDEVCAAGYLGSYSRVTDYVRASRPREPVEAPVRFETPAGRQGQVDFGTFTLPWGRRHALVIVLGYSRLLWLRFYPRQTMAVLMEALESGFDRFGGVPEELLFDQMRAVVLSDDRAAGGGLVLNAEFLRFAAHWGFLPRSCRPYRARTKGKVERPIRYIRESFFYGRTFAIDNDLNEPPACVWRQEAPKNQWIRYIFCALCISGYITGVNRRPAVPTSQDNAVKRYRKRLKREGWVRCEVKVRREDVPLVRKVAAVLNDPEREAVARAVIRERFVEAPPSNLKDLLAAAPLEGIDIERPRDPGREIDL